jgi:hypothetical protein
MRNQCEELILLATKEIDGQILSDDAVLKLALERDIKPRAEKLAQKIQEHLVTAGIKLPGSRADMKKIISAEKKQQKMEEKEAEKEARVREKTEKKQNSAVKAKRKPQKQRVIYCWCNNDERANESDLIECNDGETCNGWVHFFCEELQEGSAPEGEYTCSHCSELRQPKRRNRNSGSKKG